MSYTPSTHDSLNVLNNLDSVRNYGSAADELETTGTRQRIPDFSEYLASFHSAPAGSHSRPSNASSIAPSLPPPPPSNPNSDTESLQKAPWEFEYPNILGSYEGDCLPACFIDPSILGSYEGDCLPACFIDPNILGSYEGDCLPACCVSFRNPSLQCNDWIR